MKTATIIALFALVGACAHWKKNDTSTAAAAPPPPPPAPEAAVGDFIAERREPGRCVELASLREELEGYLRGRRLPEQVVRRTVDYLLDLDSPPPLCQPSRALRRLLEQETLFAALCDDGRLAQAVRQRRENLDEARKYLGPVCGQGGF